MSVDTSTQFGTGKKFASLSKGSDSWWYGGGSDGWESVAIAKTEIPNAKRSGLKIGVKENGKIVEYIWHPEDITDETGLKLWKDLSLYQLNSEKNVANGYVGLNTNTLIDEVYIPNLPVSKITNLQNSLDKGISSISITGDTNKILTLTRIDGTTITEFFTDVDTNSDVYLNGLNFNVSNGTFTAVLNDANTSSVSLDGRYSLLGHTHSWEDITGKPTSFVPSNHNHNDLYFTKTEITSLLIGKENTFSKNSAFNKDFGTTVGTTAQGNDSRIINGQTAFGWGNHSLVGYLTTHQSLSGYATENWVNARIPLVVNKSFVDELNINANTLNGINSSSLAKLEGGNTLTGSQTINGTLNANGEAFFRGGTYGLKATWSNTNQSGVLDTYGDHSQEFRTNGIKWLSVDASQNPVFTKSISVINTDGANIFLNSNTAAVNNGIYLTEGSQGNKTETGAYVHYSGSANKYVVATGTSTMIDRFSIERDTGLASFKGNVTIGQNSSSLTKTLTVYSEGTNDGLTVQSRVNRARIRIADNDTSAYVIAEGGYASFGLTNAYSPLNLNINAAGDVAIGSSLNVAGAIVANTLTTGGGDAGIQTGGILGRYTAGSDNAGIHLYSNVDIGYPSGWGQGLSNTPSRGLSTYGGVNLGYNNGDVTLVKGGGKVNIKHTNTNLSSDNTSLYLNAAGVVYINNSLAYHAGNFGKTEIDALNVDADTLDGLDSNNFMRRDSFIESNLDTKFDADTFGWSNTTIGRPDSYGQGISIVSSGWTHNNSNNWITQLGFSTNHKAFFRTKVNDSNWGVWNELYHTGNSSGLVDTTTNQTIGGVKTFVDEIIIDGSNNDSFKLKGLLNEVVFDYDPQDVQLSLVSNSLEISASQIIANTHLSVVGYNVTADNFIGDWNGLKVSTPASADNIYTTKDKLILEAGGDSGTYVEIDDGTGEITIGGDLINSNGDTYQVEGEFNYGTSTSTSYTLVTGDKGKVKGFTSSSAITVTVATTSLTNVGDITYIDQMGTGEITIAAGASVTLKKNSSRQLKTDGQYSRVAIHKVGSATYRVFGELKAV